MRIPLALLGSLLAVPMVHAAPPVPPSDWRNAVAEAMPLLGHRNWILVVDSAYPLQASPGIQTLETQSGELDVVQYVLAAMDRSPHVRPLIYTDAELPFVSDDDAPGASTYRAQIGDLLHNYSVESQPHDKLLATIDEASRQFHVLVLKTRMTVPYSSVFIQLDCKYWSADAEQRMRARMGAAAAR